MFLSWTKNVSPFWLMPGCSHRLNSPTSTLFQCSFCSFEAGTVVAEPNSNRHFCFLKTIHILFEKCQMLSDSIPFSSPPGFTGICSNVVTFSAVPTCLFRILFQFIWLLFFTSHHTIPGQPFLPHLDYNIEMVCVRVWRFFPFCWLKEIDMNNSFIATNEILWMQNPYKLFLVVLLSRCYHRLFV